MADGVIRIGDVVVAEYQSGAELPAHLGPRPHLHPIRTLGGEVVTDAQPEDHPWHLGLSVALQDVDGWNFWGGPTCVRDQGYVHRDDHGRIDSTERTWTGTGLHESLRWRTPEETLLVETRRLRARPATSGWELVLTTTLANATARTLTLGSPATNGRPGAGYGGLFWRLPPTKAPEVFTAEAEGETAVHGTRTRWISWTDHSYTLVMTGTDDPWFVRLNDYPGVGQQLVPTHPLELPRGTSTTRHLRTLIADAPLTPAQAETWAATSREA